MLYFQENESDNLDNNFNDYEEEEEVDNDPFSDVDEDWQAEEATQTPAKTEISSLTKYKWESYGTREKVEESRRQQLNLNPSSERKYPPFCISNIRLVKPSGEADFCLSTPVL